jgi:Protein of unknown function (DUF2961)
MLRHLFIPLLCATAARGEITFASLLCEMTDRTVVTHWPAFEYQSLQASSYNRAAKTPADPNGWFANSDCGFEIRKETTAGRTECVLMEHHGPGVITRIWTPFFQDDFENRKGTHLRIYIDGETEPRFQGNMIELLTGNGPVKPPFAQTTVRAGCLYLPIPFAKSIKVTREDSSFFYIINYRVYQPGAAVESFHPEMLQKQAALLETAGKELVEPTAFTQGKTHSMTRQIAPGESALMELPAGPSAVRHLEFRHEAAHTPNALRSTVLEMHFDDESCVWCPLGDFFSNVNGIDPHAMWERQVKADGTMICRWVMPYQKSATLRLHNLATTPVELDVKAVVAPWDWDENSLHFRTHWWTDSPIPPRPVRDMNFIDINGRGIHVGDTLVVLNPLWSWWGEGDEKIYVDDDLDRRFPSQFGTGSEDYYGWAGGVVPTRKDEFSAPFVANVRVGGETRDWPQGEEPYTHGYNICTRTRSLDATPFARRFKFDMEAFNMIGSPDAYLQYALVTHWYGAPGAIHNRPPLPEAAAAPVPQTGDVAEFSRRQLRPDEYHIKGAIELEDVRETALSPGLKAGKQVIGDALPPHRWSNASQFLASAVKPGDSATFTLIEQYQPKRIKLYPTVSHDYGIVNILVNDRLAVEKWNGYSPSSQPAEPLDLGVHKPDGNVIRLKIEVTGKDGKSAGHFFGLDAVVLEGGGE